MVVYFIILLAYKISHLRVLKINHEYFVLITKILYKNLTIGNAT